MDIFIKNVPSDCKVIIDAKNYNEDLNDHIEQIKEYTFDEAALLTVIANGSEIRIYSPLRGVAFEKSLLHSFKRQDLDKESVWNVFSALLHYDRLATRKVLETILDREREIRETMVKEEHFRKELDDRISVIDGGIEIKEEEIEQLKSEKENLQKEAEVKISEIWNEIGLPLDLFKYPTSTSSTKNNKSQIDSGDTAGTIICRADEPPNLSFTKIIQATFGTQNANKWNSLVRCAVRAALQKNLSIGKLRSFSIPIQEGQKNDEGYHPLPGMNVSVAGVDAGNAWSLSLRLAKELNVKITVRFRWPEKDGAGYPGKEGLLQWKP
jgi:hypothetical protein